MQSHGGQVRHLADIPRWCDDVTDSTGPGRFARRSLLKAAVLGRQDEPGHPLAAAGEASAGGEAAGWRACPPRPPARPRALPPPFLVLRTERGEQRFPLAASAQAWRGS